MSFLSPLMCSILFKLRLGPDGTGDVPLRLVHFDSVIPFFPIRKLRDVSLRLLENASRACFIVASDESDTEQRLTMFGSLRHKLAQPRR